MENSRFSSKTAKPTKESGISRAKLPQVLPYPQFLPFDSTLSIRDVFCYIIKHYGHEGLSVLIYRQAKQDQVVALCGDWKGNNIDIVNNDDRLAKIGLQFMQKELHKFLEMMQLTRIEQAQFFFAIDPEDQLVLVDMQVAYNKLASPGMIRDIFGNICMTQESCTKPEIIDARAVEAIKKGTGSYEGDIILKPARFRMYHEAEANSFQPMYVEMIR